MLINTSIYSIILMFLLLPEAYAHGNLSVRIDKKTIEISENPKNPILYFERGFLYYQHHEYNKAIKDYLTSEHLGLQNKLLAYRKTETYYQNNQLKKALKQADICLQFDATDIKTHKLKAKILFRKKKYKEALIAYGYVIENTKDLQPEDYMLYCEIILSVDNRNYTAAIEALDLALSKSRSSSITFQLKKIEFLKKIGESQKVIDIYNNIIQDNKRREFLYYDKAKYLSDIGDNENSNIALQQAKLAISELKIKFQNTIAIKKLQSNINDLETKLRL